MGKFIADHWVTIAFVAAYVGVAAVAVMPKPGDPRPTSTKLYEAFYDLLHLLANKAQEKNPKLASASVTVTPGTETVIKTPTTVTEAK